MTHAHVRVITFSTKGGFGIAVRAPEPIIHILQGKEHDCDRLDGASLSLRGQAALGMIDHIEVLSKVGTNNSKGPVLEFVRIAPEGPGKDCIFGTPASHREEFLWKSVILNGT